MSNEFRNFWRQLTQQGTRKPKSGLANPRTRWFPPEKPKPELVRGLRTSIVRQPGVSQRGSAPLPVIHQCDCPYMPRRPPEPPPSPAMSRSVDRQRHHTHPLNTHGILSLHRVNMQKICVYAGPHATSCLLLSGKAMLYHSVWFMRFSDFMSTGLQSVSRWAIRACAIVNCHISQASAQRGLGGEYWPHGWCFSPERVICLGMYCAPIAHETPWWCSELMLACESALQCVGEREGNGGAIVVIVADGDLMCMYRKQNNVPLEDDGEYNLPEEKKKLGEGVWQPKRDCAEMHECFSEKTSASNDAK